MKNFITRLMYNSVENIQKKTSKGRSWNEVSATVSRQSTDSQSLGDSKHRTGTYPRVDSLSIVSRQSDLAMYVARIAAVVALLVTLGVGNVWGTDYTIYVTGALFGDAWDDETSTIYLGYNYYDSGDKWKEPFELTNTGKTYEGSPIYSAVVNYSSAKLFFKHYQGGEEKSSYQASAGSDWTDVSGVAGKIYRGYIGSTHTWATYGRDITVYAVPESMDGSKWTEGNTLKAVFKYGDQDSEKTDKLTFTKTDETYKGNYIYKSPSVLIPYNVIKKISFYYNDGSDKDLYDLTPGSQYGTDDIDGKIFLGYISSSHTWVNYGRDVTVYSIPDYLFEAYGTPYSEASHYPAVCIQMENGSTWDTENMTKTSYTYATYPIYKATILIKNNKFWEYQIKYFKKSDDTQVNLYQFNNYEPKTEYAPTFIDDKIYRGYITDAHVFTPYSYDLALNQQGGASGSSSVIVAEGSAMPSATMPSNSGYSFGGYYDEVAGGGTQYYAANGSSATNWDNRTKTTLYAKWTQDVTLDREGATTGSTSVGVTYNSATLGSMTNPEKDNYTFAGYWTGDNGTGTEVISTSKVLQANVTNYTGAGGVWTHSGATTLYAKWTETPRTITTSAGEGGSVDAASYTAYVATTCAISATPATGYKFSHWSVESGTVTFADQYSASTTITATEDSEIKANFVYRWSIAGSWLYYPETVNWDADTYAMGNITKDGDDDVCSVEITLPANTNYTFQVVDRSSSPYTWWGNSNDDKAPFYMTYGISTNWEFDDDYTMACGITTAGAGTYTFTWNITDKQLTVTYPISYYVTAATAGGGTVTPSSATYMSTSVGGEITATPNYAYYFNGWTSNAGGSFTNASAATTTFKPASADATVTAAFAERTAFIEANFQVYNSDRSVRTKTGNSWSDNSTAIKMNYDAGNNRYYLHTYSTPAELKEQLNNADAYFYIKTSSSTSSIANDVSYHASGADALQSLSAYGSSNKKATSTVYTAHSFKFTGSEDGYVIIYFDGSNVWYELECALSYYGGEGATGDAPAARTYYAYGSNQTAASNSYSKTGYNFANWNTASGGGGTTYAAGATNVAMNAHEVCLNAQWTPKTYTVRFENLGADAGHKGSLDTTVTFNDTINMKGKIEVPSKTHYNFGGYYISTDEGTTLTNIQIIDANGNWNKGISGYTGTKEDVASWICAGDTVLYAKWTDSIYTVAVQVSPAGAGEVQVSGSAVSEVTAGYTVRSSEMTPIALAGWKFKEWQVTSNVQMDLVNYHSDYQQGTANKMKINATADAQTITAVFEPRFSLVGSEYGSSNTKGMPGWEDYTKTFTVNSSDPVNLTCSRTLEASTTYKFQIHDCAESKNLGAGTDGQYVLLENASAVMANQDKDVKFTSTGAGTYIFHITAIDGSYHPTVEILWPHQTNFGRRRVDIDGTAHDDNTGGTLVVKAGESTISTGSWHTYGTNIAYDADNQTGYQLAWYNSSSYSETFSAGGEWNHDLTSNDNCYAQFSELATKVSLENDGYGKVQIGGVDKTETTCGITTSRTITAVPNTGYSFSGWTKPSGDDLNFTADATNPKTFTSKGGGLQSGQRIYANFSAKTYSVKLNNDHGGEDSDDGSATATYDATSLSSITHAQFSGWTLLGYWNSSAVQVTDENGDLQANVDGYTDGSAKWTKDGDANLWAHWSRSVSLDREGGATGATSMTVIYKSSTLGSYSAPTKAGYAFAGYYTDDNGTGTLVINTSGVLQSNVTGYTNSSGEWTKVDATTLYAKWTPATLTFTGETDSDWDKASNWSPEYLPTIEHDVVLNVPVEVNIDHATAKSIVIDQSESNTGKLTIRANKGLEVAGTIQVYNGSSYSATTPADLVLESSASGNATLIFNNSNNCKATVQMYSKGWTTGEQGGGTWNWQFVGVPVTDATRINDYYGGYMYEWNTSTRGWDDVTNTDATLSTFKAYSVSYPTGSGDADKLHTYSIDGTLAATTNQTINLAAGQTVQAAANSWTAPIRINNITSTNWSPATIFLYNTGYNPEGSAAGKEGDSGDRYAAGKYLPIPVNSAPYLDESYIAPMQGFLFKNTKSGSAGTITLNYSSAVRTDGSEGIVAGAMHAPQRQMEAEPTVMKIYVSDSQYDDRVVLLARNDFSRGFDNGWDGEKFQVNAVKTAPRLFAINETGGKEEVSAIPEIENTVIGFRPGTEETYTIRFDYNGAETLYLRDTRTGAETLITNESEYVFLSDGTNEDARFIISRIQSTPTGLEETGAGSKAYKLMIDEHIYIIRDGRMYSVDGQCVK